MALDNASIDESSASSITAAALSGTPRELFSIWQSSCFKNNDAAGLRKEACSFFKSLVATTRIQVVGNTTLQTKSSHEEALAVLLQQLGTALACPTHAPRLRALETLLGALEGITTSTSTTMSDKMMHLLGTFLASHCAPLVGDDDDKDDLEDDIRDAAIAALTVLVWFPSPTLPTISNASSLAESIRLRLQLARQGVENRCAVPQQEDEADDDDDDDDDYNYNNAASSVPVPVQAGLSMLPRSRRSLCFDLLRASVDAVSTLLQQLQHQQEPNIIKETALARLDNNDNNNNKDTLLLFLPDFVTFTCNCLHGESDPRCLFQLLQLFHATAVCCLPLFAASTSSSVTTFPVDAVFDAVAPYYPIQFTPPLHDVHGITKAGLKQALLAVLCYTEYDTAAEQAGNDSMLSLSLGLILEQIMPPGNDEEERTNMTEKLAALQDLSALLFPDTNTNDTKKDCTATTRSRIENLQNLALRQLSDAFLALHLESSIEVAKGGQEKLQAKQVADLCRTMVARVALECEQSKSKSSSSASTTFSSLWQTFVAEPMQALSSAIVSAPSQGRVAIAYMACLSSCGGPKTLTRGLELGLAPLLTRLGAANNNDEEDNTATAIYGVGAFFSACSTSLVKAEQEGVYMCPHPLQPYSARAVQVLNGFLLNQDVLPLRVAAVRAMESVLIASPASHFVSGSGEDDDDDDDETNISWSTFLHSIMDPLLLKNLLDVDCDNKQVMDWLHACTQTAGCILGNSVGISADDAPSELGSVLESGRFRSVVDGFLLAILSSAMMPSGKQHIPRYDWKVLAKACSTRSAASFRIVGALVESLRDALDQKRVGDVQSCARVLGLIFQKGGDGASKAYHDLSSPSVTAFDVIKTLYSFGTQDGKPKDKGLEAGFGTSLLELPPSEEDRKNLESTMNRSYRIVSMLRRAYQTRLSSEQLKKLLITVSNALPPLNEADAVKLSILLPLLSAALVSSTPSKDDALSIAEDILQPMVSDLAEFSMTAENYLHSRSHALLCLQSLLSSFTSGKAEKCPCQKVITGMVVPSLQTATDQAKAEQKDPQKRRRLSSAPSIEECFSLLAVLGSAAAYRGGCSSKTADEVVLFFVDLACTNKGSLSFDGATGINIDLAVSGKQTDANNTVVLAEKVALAAASSLGSVLSTAGGMQLWKQRLTHVAAKRMQGHIGVLSMSALPTAGVVSCACYIACTSKLQVIGNTNLNMLALVVARGLSLNANPSSGGSVTKLVLAALLKLMAVAPASLSGNAAYLASGIMRAFASNPDPESGIAVKLLALQALESLARADSSLSELSAVKPAVVSILAVAMNHPSSILRHAAVEVRNAWYVAGNV